jgi:alkanesulfonate monooxygenase SsuD/methylene tetrahydromethanopterin reductase-like flavin-dependent oxidoreductase (luciferase family)
MCAPSIVEKSGAAGVSSIRFGIALWSQATTWDDYLDAARLVDRLGYDTLWTNDHLLSEVGPPGQVKFEAWTTLAAWATATTHSQLGHWVGCNTFRNPALVAKMAVTVDHASHGRAILGIGGGWFELEHAAFGIDFGRGDGQRLDWLDEAMGIVRRLFNGETVTHNGPRYRVQDLTLYPPPVRGTLPIMIGGAGERKTLRTVAKYADMWDVGITPDVDVVRRKLEVLAAHCAAVGRDLAAIERVISPTVYIRDDVRAARRAYEAALRHNGDEPDPASDPWIGPPEVVAERMRPYVELGFRHFIVDLPAPFDRETIERWIGEVRPLLVRDEA